MVLLSSGHPKQAPAEDKVGTTFLHRAQLTGFLENLTSADAIPIARVEVPRLGHHQLAITLAQRRESSIHAGANDHADAVVLWRHIVSIHAPARARTAGDRLRAPAQEVSIHAPARARTACM